MSDELKIEKGIPIPEKRWSTKLKYANVFRAMQPGDSVVLPVKTNVIGTLAARLWGGAGSYVSRREGDKIRVWRLK